MKKTYSWNWKISSILYIYNWNFLQIFKVLTFSVLPEIEFFFSENFFQDNFANVAIRLFLRRETDCFLGRKNPIYHETLNFVKRTRFFDLEKYECNKREYLKICKDYDR